MHGDHEIWIIGGNHYAGYVAADIAKIAGVTELISVDLHGIQYDRDGLPLRPAVLAKFVLRVMSELHARLRAWRGNLSPPLNVRNADFERAAVDLGLGAVGCAVVGDGGG